MCKLGRYIASLMALSLIIGCGERQELSPIEIKINDDEGYTSISDAVSAGPAAVANTHVVSGNETLFDIANKYNVDPKNLANINGIDPPYELKDNQVLRLPDQNAQNSIVSENVAVAGGATTGEEGKKRNEKSEKLDAKFTKFMAANAAGKTKNGSVSNSKTNSKKSAAGMSFNEQEEALSIPPVTEPATGAKKSETATTSVMIYPVRGEIISEFGDAKDGIPNDGINIKSNSGEEVKAAADGDVIYAKDKDARNKLEEFGNVVIIQHDNDLITSYAHLDKISVKKDAKVSAGDKIGEVGTTGDVTEPQLHFEVMKDKIPVDPMKYLPKEKSVTRRER